MDIGDPSEIPTTRKKLPSMQELGAFDLTAAPPTSHPPIADPPTAPPPAPSTASGGLPPRRPTPQQLRTALERADPATRKKLLRLIAGGQVVERLGEQAAGESGQAHQLAMTWRGPPKPTAAPAPRQPPDRSERPAGPIDGPVNTAGKKLLQIDARTELLEAAPKPLSAEQRKAALQAQLTESQAQEAPRNEAGAAHKVLFPAYDPRQHGDDVRRPARRPDAPVEGHFPAPRQPFQARYQHADGRPMNEEENQVEVVLQQERCEQTLEVLARDGVNGLLLSPRDLDAAVENGTLDEPTATLLWKTWSALRPVIHVIDDEPTRAINDGDPVDTAIDTAVQFEQPMPDEAEAIAEPGAAESIDPLFVTEDASLPESPGVEPAIGPRVVPSADLLPAAPASPFTKPPIEPMPAIVSAPVVGEPIRDDISQNAGRRTRLFQLLRVVVFGVVGLCVAYSAAQFSTWAWLRWGHWLIR